LQKTLSCAECYDVADLRRGESIRYCGIAGFDGTLGCNYSGEIQQSAGRQMKKHASKSSWHTND